MTNNLKHMRILAHWSHIYVCISSNNFKEQHLYNVLYCKKIKLWYRLVYTKNLFKKIINFQKQMQIKGENNQNPKFWCVKFVFNFINLLFCQFISSWRSSCSVVFTLNWRLRRGWSSSSTWLTLQLIIFYLILFES